jgi:hypothetical protein
MATLSVKNWSEFQHYKDRNPSWIKLHKRTLDDRDFQRLPVASRALAPMLWLLASEYEGGILPYDVDLFAFRTRQTEKEIESALKPLIEKGFFVLSQDASTTLADCLQPAMPRREEKRREEKSLECAFELPSSVNQETWEAYREMRVKIRKPMTDHARDLIIKDLEKFATAGYDINAILNESIKRNWTGVFAPKTPPISSEAPKARQWAPVTEMAPRGAQ